jgi:hypothetical protein
MVLILSCKHMRNLEKSIRFLSADDKTQAVDVNDDDSDNWTRPSSLKVLHLDNSFVILELTNIKAYNVFFK